jgi:hypothetical protein
LMRGQFLLEPVHEWRCRWQDTYPGDLRHEISARNSAPAHGIAGDEMTCFSDKAQHRYAAQRGGLEKSSPPRYSSREIRTGKGNLKPLFAGGCEPLCVRPRNVLLGFCDGLRIGLDVTRRCATQLDGLHDAELERSRAIVASMFYALRAGLFGRRVRRSGGSSLRPDLAAGEKALPRLDEPWTIQWRWPVVANERHVCLRGCDASLHAQIHWPGCSVPFPDVWPCVLFRLFFVLACCSFRLRRIGFLVRQCSATVIRIRRMSAVGETLSRNDAVEQETTEGTEDF